MVKDFDKVEILELNGLNDKIIDIGDIYEVVNYNVYPNNTYEFTVRLYDGTEYTMCDLDVKSGNVKII